jgi:hypothetical protein
MKVLAWLGFPLVATLLAMCWAAWRGRSRGPRRSGGAFASVEDFRRFNEALAAPGPRATPERRRGLRRRTPENADRPATASRFESATTPGSPNPQDSTAKPRTTGTAKSAGQTGAIGTARTGFGGGGTVAGAGALESVATLATRKLGSAETFGSTKIAGQGS